MPPTPTLDLKQNPPKLQRSWWSLTIGVTVGIVLVSWSSIDGLTWFAALFISVALHELGHVLAGKLMGMETGGVIVNGLMILKSGDRWGVRFDIRRLFSGGVARPLPRKGEFNRAQSAWMVAGGPIVTAFLAAASGIAYAKSTGPPGWLSSFWWVNLILFASVLSPAHGVNKSDGPRLWMLLRNPEKTRAWTALLQVQAEEVKGVRPRDWDSELFEQMLEAGPEGADFAYRRLLAYYRLIDTGDSDGALGHLELALAHSGSCGKLVRWACFLEAFTASALLRSDPAAARVWLARAKKLRRPRSRHAIEAAIAQSEGRYSEALAHWDEALQFLISRKVGSGLGRFANDRIAEYQNQCRAASATT